MLTVTQLSGFMAGRATATITEVATASSATNASSYTFSSQAFGAAFTGRVLAVAISSRMDAGTTISGVSVGGNAATLVVQANEAPGDINRAEIWALALDAGTSGDVVITLASGNGANMFMTLYSLFNATGVAAFDTDTDTGDPCDFSLAIPDGGIGLGVVCATIGISNTWTGLAEDNDQLDEDTTHSTAFVDEFPGTTLAIQAADAGTPAAMAGVVASWAPRG